MTDPVQNYSLCKYLQGQFLILLSLFLTQGLQGFQFYKSIRTYTEGPVST